MGHFIVVGFDKPVNEANFFSIVRQNQIGMGYPNEHIKFGTRGTYYLEIEKNSLAKLKELVTVKEVIENYQRGIFRDRVIGSYNIRL